MFFFRLSVFNSLVDDTGFRSIGETMHHLVELNASRTWITNGGIKFLCLDDDQVEGGGAIANYRFVNYLTCL